MQRSNSATENGTQMNRTAWPLIYYGWKRQKMRSIFAHLFLIELGALHETVPTVKWPHIKSQFKSKIYKRYNGRTTHFKCMRVSMRTRGRHDIATTENLLNSNSLCCFVRAFERTINSRIILPTRVVVRFRLAAWISSRTRSSFFLWPLSMGAAHSLIERHCVYNWYLSSSSSSWSPPPPSFIVHTWPCHKLRCTKYQTRISIYRFIRNHFSLDESVAVTEMHRTKHAYILRFECAHSLTISWATFACSVVRAPTEFFRNYTSRAGRLQSPYPTENQLTHSAACAADTFCRCNRL